MAEKWNWKKVLGISLIISGLFIILTARVLTGAVIGFQPENYLGLFGLLILIGGIVLVLGGRERLMDLAEVVRNFKGIFPIPRARVIIPRPGHTGELRGRKLLRDSNKEAQDAAKEVYKAEKGRYPNKMELKEFIRGYHERGDIDYLLERHGELSAEA